MLEIKEATLIYRGETRELDAGVNPELRSVLGSGACEVKCERRPVTPDDVGDLAYLLRDAAFSQRGAGDRLEIETAEGTRVVTDPAVLADVARFFAALWNGTRKIHELSLRSFDGGGPEFKATMDPVGIVTWTCRRHYFDPNHESMCGSGYEVLYTFRPVRPGKARARVTGMAFYGPEPTQILSFTVDEALGMAVTQKTENE